MKLVWLLERKKTKNKILKNEKQNSFEQRNEKKNEYKNNHAFVDFPIKPHN